MNRTIISKKLAKKSQKEVTENKVDEQLTSLQRDNQSNKQIKKDTYV